MSDTAEQSDVTTEGSKSASGGDDERENREQIDKAGELNRDELGNADGVS